MRAEAQLRRFKVIVVTDRKDLQRQLSVTATLTGEVVEVADSTTGVKALARRKGPGLIFATIQKYRDTDTAGDTPLTADDLPKVEEPKTDYKAGERFEVLNEDEAILVLVDEAHRTQAGTCTPTCWPGYPIAHASASPARRSSWVRKSAPTRSLASSSTATRSSEAEADGATVPVLYEGRTANGAIKDGASLDELFEDLFRQHTPEELEAIKQKYATRGHIFDAPALIADKARDIIRHYVTNILPNGYKAQVVAYKPPGRDPLLRGLEAGPRRVADGSRSAEPAGQGAGRRGPVPAPAEGASRGAGLALP